MSVAMSSVSARPTAAKTASDACPVASVSGARIRSESVARTMIWVGRPDTSPA